MVSVRAAGRLPCADNQLWMNSEGQVPTGRTAVTGPGGPLPGSAAKMQPALLLALVLPPPAPGPLGFAGAHRARAGGAADRDEAFLVQRIGRHAVRGGEGARRLARPVEQRAELEEAAPAVGLDQIDAARCADWSARRPVIQPLAPASARFSGSTLRTSQQAARASRDW